MSRQGEHSDPAGEAVTGMDRSSPQTERMTARRRRNRKRYYRYEILSFVVMLVVIYAACTGVIRYVGQKTLVEGASMSPTLENGDVLVVDKISYRLTDPKRFDVVVFRYLYKEDSYYIKRIIGLPGETVQIKEGYVYINGSKLEEDFGSAVMTNPGRAIQPVTLGADEYFVLGDNRNISSDSRDPSVANVAREQIVGKAILRVYPLQGLGLLRHK